MAKKKGGRYTPPAAPLTWPVAPEGDAFWPWYRRMQANPILIHGRFRIMPTPSRTTEGASR